MKKLVSKAAEERRERKNQGKLRESERNKKKRTEQGKTDDGKDVRPALVTESNKNQNMYVQG